MDGVNYKRAMARHKTVPDESHIRACFEAYRENGIGFVRDGGDAYGVSSLARHIAPEYGIDYRTPLFAIHKRGHYGGIVGYAFDDLRGYAELVGQAREQGADFIKIMTTGIMDFNEFGRITHEDLKPAEVCEMVHIAHEHGMAVMSHTNGKRAVLAALEAGVDSIEHGNYVDGECVDALFEAHACFVPTAAVARNLRGRGLFDESVLERIYAASLVTIAAAAQKGCLLAVGSDAGAVGVPHGTGAHDEYACFEEAIPDAILRGECIERGNAFIRATFQRSK